MNNKEPQQHQAQFLYLQTDLTHQQIAEMLGIDRKTLHNWIKSNNWIRARYALKHAPCVLAEHYYKQLSAINNDIMRREDRPYPTKEEAEIIRKLNISIKHTREEGPTLSDNIEIFSDFAYALRKKDLKVAQQFAPLMNDYIQSKINSGGGLDSGWRDYLNDQEEDREYERWLKDKEVMAHEAAIEAARAAEEQEAARLHRQMDGEMENTGTRLIPLPVNHLRQNEPGSISPSGNISAPGNTPMRRSTDYYSTRLEEKFNVSKDPHVKRVIHANIGVTIVKSPSPLWGLDESIFFMSA